MSKLYLAYGSNIHVGQMAGRCQTARIVDTAELPGYELVFRGSPDNAVANIEPNEQSSVPVLIWSIKKNDELALDRYEGFPYLYEKETLSVTVKGKQTECMAYIMTPGHSYGCPRLSYYQTILAGYEIFDFDPTILKAAKDISLERCYTEMTQRRQNGPYNDDMRLF